MKQIKGKFEVKSMPLELDSLSKELGLMKMKFEKNFEGELRAISTVSMIGTFSKEINSGGYVAIERIEGELGSKKGSFYLQHSSSMSRGVPTQSISVIPDSGTDQLKGISGNMTIDIIEGQHFYTFNYYL
jgi:hypothetical protein